MSELRQIVKQNLPALAEKYFAIMLNKPEAGMMTAAKEKQIIDAFEKVLIRLPVDNPDFAGQTGLEVIQAVNEGRITVDEAQKLMQLVTQNFEMTELQDLIVKLAEAGVELE